jgi:hypothetical protein
MAITNNFGVGVSGTAYVPNSYAELGNAIGKVALQIIREVEAKNPLSAFDKGAITNGDTIEQAIVKLVEASGYDQTGAGTLTRDTREKMAVKYFNNWQRHTYKTSVDIPKLKKILLSGTGASDVAQKLVSVLGVSATNDRYQSLKALLHWGTQEQTTGQGDSPLVHIGSAQTSIKGLLKELKNTINGMTFVNTTYNSAGINRATKLEDIMVVMPYTLRNAIDVDELAGVFNLSKDELKARIIVTDSTDREVFIVDRNAIVKYNRLYEMADQKNGEGLFWNYFLHVEDLFAISPLFDGCYITYTNAIA